MPIPGDGSEGQRVVFFFLILFFIYLQPANPPQRIRFGRGGYWDTERQRDFDVLANTTYGDFGPGKALNLTAFREDDEHHWDLLPRAKSLSQQQFANNWRGLEDVAFYQEITGDVRGDFKRSSISLAGAPALNLTALDPRKDYILDYFQRNVTEDTGSIDISIKDSDDKYPSGEARSLTVELSITAESAPGQGWQAVLQGVHLPNGAAILTTSSTKFDALPALPHFTLDVFSFIASVAVMNDTVTKAWEHAYLRDTDIIGIPRCEMILWLQPKPLLGSSAYLQMIESELLNPQGAPIGMPPALSFSMVLFSPDCGYVLEADTLAGAKVEVYTQLTNRLLFAFLMLLALQITLIKRQMKKSSTPSTRSRISYQSIVIAALGDGLVMLAMLMLLSLNDASFMLIAAVVFTAIIHVAFLEVKFVFDLWNIQVGEPQHAEAERERREYLQRRQQQQAAQQAQAQAQAQAQPQAQPPSTDTDGETNPPGAFPTDTPPVPAPATAPLPPDTLPLPVTAPRPPIPIVTGASPLPIFMPSDQDGLEPVITPTNAPTIPTTNTTTTTTTTPATGLNALPTTTADFLASLPPPTPRSSFATTYARFYFLLILLLMFSLLATSFPRPLRSFYFTALSTFYLSLWLPQIYRNILRNCRKALTWEFVIGSSICRVVPVVYWYAAERNILAVKGDKRVAVALVLWVVLQVGVLVGQRVWGGRWMLFGLARSEDDGGWLPRAWEYHPLLVEGDDQRDRDVESAGAEEALLGPASKKIKTNDGEMPVALLASAGEAKEDEQSGAAATAASGMSRRTFDCAICMNEIDVPVVKKTIDPESGKGKGLATSTARGFGLGFERASYMVTPCRHIFHAECLEGWMGLRLVCPVCREELPPL